MYTLFCAGPPAPPGSLTNVSALCRHWREPQRRWLGATVSLNATNGPNPPPPPPPPPPPQNLPGEYVSHRPPRGPSPTTLTSTHPAAPRPCPARCQDERRSQSRECESWPGLRICRQSWRRADSCLARTSSFLAFSADG